LAPLLLNPGDGPGEYIGYCNFVNERLCLPESLHRSSMVFFALLTEIWQYLQ